MDATKKGVWIGIDGGGTKTTSVCIEADSHKVLGTGLAGSTNSNSVGEAKASGAMQEAIQAALTAASVDNTQVLGICIGASGVDRESDKVMVRGWIRPLLPNASITIHNDAVIALASGTEGALFGLVVISGTGTITVGYNSAGESTRSSGWGPLLGDDGSGYQLGYLALKAVMRAVDKRGPETKLVEAVLTHLGMKSHEELIGWAYSEVAWERFAKLAPLIVQCAAEGDAVAEGILNDQLNELVVSISSVVNKLQMKDVAFPLVFAGGNLSHEGSVIAARLKAKCAESFPLATIVMPTLSAELAAAMLIAKAQEHSTF